MQTRLIWILATLTLVACEQRPIDPALPSVDSSWRVVRRAEWQASLESVLAFGPNNIYASHPGSDCEGDLCLVSESELIHYDGSTWNQIALADDQRWVAEIWGPDPDNIYVTGGEFYRYDGTSWHAQSIRAHHVTGTSNVAFAAYSRAVYELENAQWDTLRVFDNHVGDIVAATDGSLFVLTYRHMYIWDGTTWQTAVNGELDPLMVLPFSASDALVLTYSSPGGILHWDGTQLLSTGPPPRNVRALAGTSIDDAFAVGSEGATYHYDGFAWTEIPRATGFILEAAASTGLGRMVAVGTSGKAIEYDGSVWHLLREGQPRYGYAFWAESESRVIVSTHQSVFRMDESSFVEIAPPAGIYASAFAGHTIDDVYAISDRSITHFDGSGWSIETDSLDGRQLAIWASPSGLVYSAGDRSVYRRDGTWQRIYDGSIQFDAITGRGDRVFAIGGDVITRTAALAVFDGAWRTYTVPDDYAADILCTTDSEILVSGRRGIYRLEGDSFRLLTPPVGVDAFRRVFEIDLGRIVSFGFDGFAYFDGTLWSLQSSAGAQYQMTQTPAGVIMGIDYAANIVRWEAQP